MFHARPFRKYIFWLLFITQFLVFEAVSQTTVKGIINDNMAKTEILEELLGKGTNPEEIIKEKGLTPLSVNAFKKLISDTTFADYFYKVYI